MKVVMIIKIKASLLMFGFVLAMSAPLHHYSSGPSAVFKAYDGHAKSTEISINAQIVKQIGNKLVSLKTV